VICPSGLICRTHTIQIAVARAATQLSLFSPLAEVSHGTHDLAAPPPAL
jgi:hypothetical protein